ncbi:MAG TPA: alpha-amylase family glycosyl hydrolase [Bryobacteraceae bacterium]|nr:alpha-amylase family glycosyl hydrolase [Bryobacteraceae bacterium]
MPASNRPYMGAIPYNDGGPSGTTFRVWAKFATSVAVAGEFNAWSTVANPLFPEGDGYWSTDVAGAEAGDMYKFVLVNPAIPAPLWRMDPYAGQIAHDAAGTLNGVIASAAETYEANGYSTPPWNELVIYELHIRSFVYGGGYQGTGSFQSAATKLSYLSDLGINAIELMPLGEFTGDISAGYNPAYIFAVEDEFGGPDGFRDFVNQAHQHGIAVIVDVVYNHLGDSAGDMWQFDGWSQNGKGGIYFYNDWRSHTDWGETRFDYGRGEVCQYLRDNALRWLEQRFADGLRWDSTGSIRNVNDQNNDPGGDLADGWALMQRINSEIGQRQPWKISIAEDMKENEWITKDAGSGGAGFNAQWSSAFVSTIRGAIIGSDDGARDMNAVADAIAHKYNESAFQRVIFTESHDADSNGAQRVPEMIWPGNAGSWYSKKRSTLGAALVMTAPAIPMIFMGQEFLCPGWFNDDQPLDWSNAAKFPGITQLYRDLIRLRRNWFNNTRGLRGQNVNVHHVNSSGKVIGFHRWDQGGNGDDVVVVLNFGNQGYANYALGFPRDGAWRVRFNSDWNGYDASFGSWSSYDTQANGAPMDTMPASANVGLGPYTALILSQD